MNECTTILVWYTWKRNMCCDVIFRALCRAQTYPVVTQKGVADLCLCQLASYNARANACAYRY